MELQYHSKYDTSFIVYQILKAGMSNLGLGKMVRFKTFSDR